MIKGYATDLNVHVPERRKHSRGDFDLTAKVSSKWRDNLPLANAGMAGKEIYAKLKESNQLIFSGKERLNFLEATIPAIQMVLQAMDQSFVGKSFPLPDKASRVGQSSVGFVLELALSYQIAVIEYTGSDGSVSILHKKKVSLAAHRCAYFLGEALVRSFQLYQPIDEKIWYVFHRLAQYTENRKIARKPIQSPDEKSSPGLISAIYQSLLCLSAAHPYRMRQIDIRPIYDVLREQGIEWNRLSLDEQDVGSFVVDPDIDSGPLHFKGRDLVGVAAWGLDLSAAIASLEELLGKTKGRELMPPGAESLERALVAWNGVASRTFKRLTGEYQLNAVFGLHATHYEICDEMDFDDFLSKTGMTVGLEVARGDDSSWANSAHNVFKAEIIKAAVLDQSLGGYRLSFTAESMPKIQIGELVSLSQSGTSSGSRDWVVGVVRWMNVGVDSDVECGVQLLTRHCEAVAFKVDGVSASAAGMQRGILVSEHDELPRIILPAHLGKPGQVVTITNRSIALEMGIIPEDLSVRLGQVVELTASFAMLDFEEIDNTEYVTQSSAGAVKIAVEDEPDLDFDLDDF